MRKEKLKEIWRECFSDSEEYTNWYFENIYKEEDSMVIERNGEIQGGLHNFRYNFQIGSSEGSVDYLVGIGVLPEYRGMGVMDNLLRRVFEENKKNGKKIVTLTPVNERIYKKYGFEYITELEKYSFYFSESIGEKVYDIKRVTEANLTDNIILDILNVYLENMRDKKIYVKRSKEGIKKILEELFFEDGLIYTVSKENRVMGYFFLMKESGKLLVKEMMYSDLNSLKTIFYILEGYKNYYENLEIIMPKNSGLDEVFIEKKKIKKEIVKKLQGRIILVKEFLESVVEKIDKVIYVNVIDNILEENNKIYKIKNGYVEISKENIWDIKIGVDALITIGSGLKKISHLEKIGKCEINSKKRYEIEQLFKENDNYFNEY